MEVQTIQARPQLHFVGKAERCEDCEEETPLESALQQGEDRVSLSETSRSLSSSAFETGEEEESGTEQPGPKTDLELSEEERRLLNELRARDAEVRAHEQAHLAAAGPYANGGPTFEYQTGPDGKQYAVGGEVSIDTSPVPGNPEATARKAQTIKRAALAPSDPSAQDRQVAAQAAQLEAQARQEAKAEKAEEQEDKNTPSPLREVSEPNSDSESPFRQRVEKKFRKIS